MVAVARVRRTRERDPVHARPRDRDVRRARRPVGRRRRVVLGRRGEGPRDLVPDPVRPGPGHVARGGMGHVVHGWDDQRRAPVPRRLGAPNPGGRGGGLGGRGRQRPPGHVPGAAGADRPAGAWSALARRAAARHRRDLHAHGHRDRGCAPRVLQAGRDLGADLQRVRSGGRRRPPGGCEGDGVDHGGRLAAAWRTGLDESDRRSRRGRSGQRSPRARLEQTRRSRHALERRARRPLGRSPGRTAGALRHRGARQRASAVHRLHQRDDGQAERRAARARRLPGEDRGGGRVPDRCAPRRRAALGDGPRLDHGPVGDRRRARAGFDRAAVRGSAEPPRPRPVVGDGGTPRRHHARRLAHAHPRADPQRHRTGSLARPLDAAHPGVDGRAVEPRAVPVADGGGRRRPVPDHQPVRRHRGGRVLPLAAADHGAEGVHAPRPGARDGRRRVGRGRDAGGARAGGGAGLQAAVARDDAGRLGGRRALPGRVLAAVPGRVGARRLGDGRRRRVLVPARAIRRHAEHRGQTAGAGRGRERARGASPRSRSPRRWACRTRSRARRSGASSS